MGVYSFIAPMKRARRRWFQVVTLAAVAILVLASCDHAAHDAGQSRGTGHLIGGLYARLLAGSTDLGADTTGQVQVTAALRETTTPRALIGWAAGNGLSIRWQPGQDWAYIDGAPGNIASAFDVMVRNYRSPGGQVFYASPQQPDVPAPVRQDVSTLDHILSYNATHRLYRRPIPQDVPCAEKTPTSCRPGLSPEQLRTAYHAGPLGTTGKGQTVVLIEGFSDDGYTTDDLNTYVGKYPQLGPFKMLPPINGQPGKPAGETEMDLEVVHAIAPDAQLVTLDIDNTPGQGEVEPLVNAFTTIDQRFPGAIVSMSMGFGCDHIWTPTATLPLKNVLMAAEARGMVVFQSSGDTGGYECKAFNSQDCTVDGCPDNSAHPAIWWNRPTDQDKGVDPVASMWEVTDVGGTTLSTDPDGAWMAEQSWVDVPLQQGTGGGPSALYDRPPFQATVSSPVDATHRLTPDVAADADPATGVDCYTGSTDDKGNVTASWGPGGGTSQSAPIWAALTALMNEYLTTHGGRAVNDLNPLLYRISAPGAARTAFHDVTLGGNAIYNAAAGYDVVTGLGTPDTDALVHDILDAQQGGR
jgi:kumamolisin